MSLLQPMKNSEFSSHDLEQHRYNLGTIISHRKLAGKVSWDHLAPEKGELFYYRYQAMWDFHEKCYASAEPCTTESSKDHMHITHARMSRKRPVDAERGVLEFDTFECREF